MRHFIRFTTIAVLFVCISGCSDEDSKVLSQVTSIEFQIALRKEGLKEVIAENDGTYNVVSHHDIPVHIGMEHEEVTSIENSIWVDIRWSKSGLRGKWLWLYDFQYRIRNNMFYNGTGGGMGWTSAGGQGFSSEWKHLNTPIDFSVPSNGSGPVLYHRIRWLNPSPVFPDIEMSEVAQRQGSES